MQVTQPCSAPSSPLASPGAHNATTFQMPAGSAAAAAASAAGASGSSAPPAAASGSPLTSSTSAAYATALMATTTASASTSASLSSSASSSASSSSCASASAAHSSSGQPASALAAYQHFVNAAAIDTGDPNWQATKSTVRERNAAMFNNDLMSDITFVVGGPADDAVQTIPAHKYVLATGSSVFYAMFFGGLADTTQEIKVPDVEPMAFLTLLK